MHVYFVRAESAFCLAKFLKGLRDNTTNMTVILDTSFDLNEYDVSLCPIRLKKSVCPIMFITH